MAFAQVNQHRKTRRYHDESQARSPFANDGSSSLDYLVSTETMQLKAYRLPPGRGSSETPPRTRFATASGALGLYVLHQFFS